MNFIDIHLGDYAADVAHLSLLEEGVYWRLLRRYFKKELPLPADTREVCRLAGARSRGEKQAVQQVLAEFFELQADGWHNGRADREIADYQAGEPEREAKKASEEERQRRHREERSKLFEQLRAAGIHADWNESIKALRALVAKHCPTPAPEAATAPDAPATAPATGAVTQPATAPATAATATHFPLPTSHSPEGNNSAAAARAPDEALSEEPLGSVTAVGKALIQAGWQPHTFSQSDPNVIAMKDLGASEREVVTVAKEAVRDGKKLGWVLAAIKGKRQDVAEALKKPAPATRQQRGQQRPATPINRQEAIEAENRRVAQEWLREQQEGANAGA